MVGLTDLPPDALLHLLALLPPREVACLGSTCRLLRNCASQDSVWKQQCEAWLEVQQRRSGCASRAVPSAGHLKSALQLGSHRDLYTVVLHSLGSWPEGVFYCTSQSAQPRGRLLVCRLDVPTASLQLLHPRPKPLGGPPGRAEDCWDLDPMLAIKVEAEGTDAQPRLVCARLSGQPCSMELSLDGQGLVLHATSGGLLLSAAPGARTLPSSGWQQGGQGLQVAQVDRDSLAAILGLSASSITAGQERYQRVPLPAPRDLQAAAGEPVGMALLRAHQGLFMASYASHGLEVLSLQAWGIVPVAEAAAGPAGSAQGAEGSLPPGCPISGPRLQALKLQGDPNVPALKHSFVVDAASCRLGPYDPLSDDPFAPEGGPARPCLAFFQTAAQLVDLEERPVLARFRAVGCINRVPGVWDPEWVPASCLVYRPPMERTLSVIFEDEGEPIRHIIDYTEFPFVSDFMPGVGS